MLKKKKQNGIPFWVVALLLFHRGQEQLGILLDLDLDPVIIFFRNTYVIGEISLLNLTKKSNHSLAKNHYQIAILFNSKYCLFLIEIKGISRCLPLSPAAS